MTNHLKFPITLKDGFPINIGPICEQVVGNNCEEECACHERENECECPAGSEELPHEHDELYKKGHPFYKITKKETTPTMTFLENFTKEDFCNLNKTTIMKKIMSNSWNNKANKLCFHLVMEAHEYAQKRNFNIKQTLALMEIFYSMFKYFMKFPLLSKTDFYKYFRELLLLYLVQDAPDSLRIFTPIEGFAIAHKFSTLFDRNYDLLRAILLPDSEIFVNIEHL